MIDRYVMFSAGGGSFRAALLWRRQYPSDNLRLVFTDTLYEDADAYRFLIEGIELQYDQGSSGCGCMLDEAA